MSKRLITIGLLLQLVLAACAGAGAEREAIRLPTAVPPSEAPGSWAITFRHEFPADFWDVGSHRYGFLIQCPEAGQPNFSSDWFTFQVANDASALATPLYLRLNGISVTPFGQFLPEPVINPAQTTEAAVHLIGMTKDAAQQALANCEALVSWDRAAPQLLTAGGPFQP